MTTTTDFDFEHLVAEFPKVEYAERFFARLSEGGWYVKDLVHKGRKVVWTIDLPDTYDLTPAQHFGEMLQTVGYYGSTENRKARLNGVAAPVVY